MSIFTSEAELQRANIRVAWSFAERLTAEQFTRLCEATVQSWSDEREQGQGVDGPEG